MTAPEYMNDLWKSWFWRI